MGIEKKLSKMHEKKKSATPLRRCRIRKEAVSFVAVRLFKRLEISENWLVALSTTRKHRDVKKNKVHGRHELSAVA